MAQPLKELRRKKPRVESGQRLRTLHYNLYKSCQNATGIIRISGLLHKYTCVGGRHLRVLERRTNISPEGRWSFGLVGSSLPKTTPGKVFRSKGVDDTPGRGIIITCVGTW